MVKPVAIIGVMAILVLLSISGYRSMTSAEQPPALEDIQVQPTSEVAGLTFDDATGQWFYYDDHGDKFDVIEAPANCLKMGIPTCEVRILDEPSQ